jgi:hypothetical protein
MIKQFGLVEKGRSEAHITFDKSFFKQGDVVNMEAVIDNSKCDKDLTEILVQLTRSIEYLSFFGKTTNIRDVIVEQKFEGVPANTILNRKMQLVLTENIKGDKLILKQNDWNKMILEPEDIILQDYLLPTVRGNLIKSLYFIEVSFTHAGLTLGSSIPKIVFPVYIFAPEISMDLH